MCRKRTFKITTSEKPLKTEIAGLIKKEHATEELYNHSTFINNVLTSANESIRNWLPPNFPHRDISTYF